MFSAQQFEYYSTRHASDPCSVCKHVLDGMDISHFGRGGSTYGAGCCEECLYSEHDRTTIRCDHLFSRQTEILSLLHLPIYGLAVRNEKTWTLGRLKIPEKAEPIEGGYYMKRSFSEFVKDTEALFVLATGKAVHESSFVTGARFMPSWTSLEDANRYSKKKVGYLLGLITRARRMKVDEVVSEAQEDGHNYLCVQENETLWECVVAKDVLDTSRNTLILE